MRKHISATALAPAAALAALGLLAAGCGGGADPVADHKPSPSESASPTPGSPTPDPSTSPSTGPGEDAGSGSAAGDGDAKTELTIDVTIRKGEKAGDTKPAEWTLTCAPAGGNHPDPEKACADLDKAGGTKGFAPVAEDRPCTYIMGGPEIATVKGHVNGTDINTKFDKSGGCELDRYEEMGAVLTP